MIAFPVPATSNRTGAFSASGFPIDFTMELSGMPFAHGQSSFNSRLGYNSGVTRLAPIPCPPAESTACQKQGSFPPPALPGFIGTTIPSAAPDSPAWLSRDAGWSRSSGPTAGVSRVPYAFLCMYVAVTTPARPMEYIRSYSPISFVLPHILGGSDLALTVSGPAQRSLTLQPTCSRSR